MATAPWGRKPASSPRGRRCRLATGALSTGLIWVVAGCSGVPTADPDQNSGGASSTAAERSVPGAPRRDHGASDGGGAAGAPIKIPARFDDQGRPLAEVTSEIEAGLRDACGGEVCVTLRTEQRDIEGFTTCTFIATVPPQRSFVRRGGTVTILSGSAPCADTSDTTGEPSDSSSTTSPTSSSGPTP